MTGNVYTLSVRSEEPCPLGQDISDDTSRDNLYYTAQSRGLCLEKSRIKHSYISFMIYILNAAIFFSC
jgi:hypothetical protein